MAKKSRKTKKSEITESESAEPDANLAGTASAGDEASPSGSVSAENADSVSPDESKSTMPAEGGSGEELLDDVRRSLMEEEVQKEEKKSKKWWRRAAKSLQKEEPAEIKMPVETRPAPPAVDRSAQKVEEQKEAQGSEEYLDEIDELIGMLEAEPAGEVAKQTTTAEPAPEPEAPVDIEDLKKQAFGPRAESQEPESFSEVRSVALEGGEEVFVEVEAKPTDTAKERMSAFENALRPYRSYIYFGIAFLGAIMAVIAIFILFNVLRPFVQSYLPAEPTPNAADLPYPISMSLPGGLNFALGRGVLKDGEWNPRGPEWLEGTEVCRWVAIPWSRQLEAVIRTLNPDDPIELTMSNNDRLVYKVYSIQQLSPEEMQQVETDTPCLLLILAEPDTEKRWVLTALP